MSCRTHTYLCSDPVLNEIPKRRAQGRPRLPLAGHLGRSAHDWESVGFQVWAPDRTMIPGIPGRMRTWASGRRHPTKGRVPLGTHTFPSETLHDDSCHSTWVSPCTWVDVGLSYYTLLVVIKLIHCCIILYLIKSWSYFHLYYYSI